MTTRSYNTLRWAARIIGLLMVLMVVALAIGEGAPNLLKSPPAELVLHLCFLFTLVGLVMAWKWEIVGGALSATALAMFYLIHFMTSGRFPGGAFPLFFIPIGLFLLLPMTKGEKHPVA